MRGLQDGVAACDGLGMMCQLWSQEDRDGVMGSAVTCYLFKDGTDSQEGPPQGMTPGFPSPLSWGCSGG